MNVHWPFVWKSSDLSMLTWQIVTIILVLCTITLWPVTCRRMSWLYNAICLKKRESENVDVAKLRSVLIVLWAVTIRLWAFFHPCLFTSSLSSSAEACCFNVLARRMLNIVTQQNFACPQEIVWAVGEGRGGVGEAVVRCTRSPHNHEKQLVIPQVRVRQ